MRYSLQSLSLLFFVLLLASCDGNNEEPVSETYTYNFEEGTEGWTAGFSDYPADWEESRLEFEFEHRELPDAVDENGRSLFISGTNLSDDLFLFLKREITGLEPDHAYSLTFEIELASQYPEESMGIGGSPGGSVYLKAGASAEEPQTATEDGDVRMNINKGNQSQGGSDMMVVGTIGIPGDEFTYQLIERDNSNQPLQVQSDSQGRLWIIVGTDSGYEGTTALYYNRISVTLEE